MIRNILVLPDGTELAAGTPGTSALRSLRWNCAVNAGTDLNPGSACADSIEAELWVEPGTAPGIAAGDRVELWRQPQGGERVKAGVFVAQQPVRSRRNLYRLTAYDPLSLTEKEISPWLRDHQGDFPLTLTALTGCGSAQESAAASVDVATARAAGVTGVAVTWGFRSRRILEEAGARRLISHPGELTEFLKENR